MSRKKGIPIATVPTGSHIEHLRAYLEYRDPGPESHIGFTGSHYGMTPAQTSKVAQMLGRVRARRKFFHHGNEPHADKQAEKLAKNLNYTPVPHNPEHEEAFYFLKRDREIAQSVQYLIAAPHQFHEILRSGTWATVRYARAAHANGTIVWPCGCSSPLSAKEHKHPEK